MRSPPIPQRIPPLRWRRPSFIWTPIALAIAIGWPALVLSDQPSLQRVAVIAGAVVFTLALLTLGASWALGRAPRTRRVVVVHVLLAGAAAAFLAPFVLAEVLAFAAAEAAGEKLSAAMSMAMTPLALVLGLPAALVSGTLFAWLALSRPRGEMLDDNIYVAKSDVQPFR